MEFVQRTDQQLRIVIRFQLAEATARLKVMPTRVSYRRMRSRWGSCSSTGNITFSTLLKYVPDSLILYVVCHELVHLKVMRHDARFKLLLSSLLPNYKLLQQALKQYGFALLDAHKKAHRSR